MRCIHGIHAHLHSILAHNCYSLTVIGTFDTKASNTLMRNLQLLAACFSLVKEHWDFVVVPITYAMPTAFRLGMFLFSCAVH